MGATSIVRIVVTAGLGALALTGGEVRWREAAEAPRLARAASPAGSSLGLAFSTFLGHYDPPELAGWNGAYAVAVDDQGFIYVAGDVLDDQLPTRNALQPQRGGHGTDDAFLVKLTPDGQELVYGTYLGGSRMDSATGVAVDRQHNATVVGYTESPDFPVAGALQARLGGGLDAFVVKLSASGDRLVYGSFLGGSFQDVAADVAVDAAGYATVVGITDSHDFPTRSAFQPTDPDRGVSEDGFVARIGPAGDLVYSTLLGGSENDAALDVAVGDDGAAVVVGQTTSADFPVHSALQPLLADNLGALRGDAFVARVASDGLSLDFATYLGGAMTDSAHGVALDASGRVLVVGRTRSADFPTREALQASLRGDWDAFVARISRDGAALDRATFLGGSGLGSEGAWDVAVLSDQSVAVLGECGSTDFPVRDPFQADYAGQRDLSLTILAPSMTEMKFGSLLGGTMSEPTRMGTSRSGPADLQKVPALAVDAKGALVVAADTTSSDFPMVNALADRFPGVLGAVVVKIGALEPRPPDPAACAFIARRVPPAVIADALANPERVPGWRELCNPAVPPGPLNYERTWLSLQNIARPYHPIANAVVFKCGCP